MVIMLRKYFIKFENRDEKLDTCSKTSILEENDAGEDTVVQQPPKSLQSLTIESSG